MEYTPRYPQPFSFSQTIDIALDPAVAWDEIARLRNSLLHLRRSQDELQEYLRGLPSEETDIEVSQAVKENDITIASQDERIFMLKLALAHHGHSIVSDISVPSESRTERPQSTILSSSNGLDDHPPGRVSAEVLEIPEVEGRENGVYL